MPEPTRVAIVGGGLASVVAGIELRDRLPNADICIHTAADEEHVGGQLASWNEAGYPVEHGLHALFSFYDRLLPIVRRVGAEGNFTRSKAHVFICENGAIHKFSPKTWLTTYGGFGLRERLEVAAFVPSLARMLLELRRRGWDAFDDYDGYDLREFFQHHGVRTAVHGNFFRQFYDAAFSGRQPLSAAVGLECLFKIFHRPWHYYFNGSSRETLIAPMLRYFLGPCRGRIAYRRRVTRLCFSADGTRVTSVATSDGETIQADEFVLALALDDFKALDLGAVGRDLAYFRNIGQLRSVASVALQAWFKNDPVPARYDSLINGLPEPFGVLCPLTRVRASGADRRLPLPYEIAACGPEAGFEADGDDALAQRFLAHLRALGFAIPRAPGEVHTSVRRNREPHDRYLLTLPGELRLRPTHDSPIANLSLAGAWVRNSLALPCAEAAAESGIRVAESIAVRRGAVAEVRTGRDVRGVLAGHPLVVPPPFHFPDSTASAFIVAVDPERLAAELPKPLEGIVGLRGVLLVSVLEHRGVFAEADPTEALYHYREVVLAAFVRNGAQGARMGFGLLPVAVYLDNDTAVAAGREVYGFPKKMADVRIATGSLSVARLGRPPGGGRGPVVPIEILRGEWDAGAAEDAPSALEELIAPYLSFLPNRLMTRVVELPFYNLRERVAPTALQAASPPVSEITVLAPTGVEIVRTRRLGGAQFTLAPSATDPLYRLAAGERLCWSASRGVRVDFRFTLGDAAVLAPVVPAAVNVIPSPAEAELVDPLPRA